MGKEISDSQRGGQAANSLDAYWMPFTANRTFKASPKLLVSAHGMHYRTADGRQVLDGTAGLWCVNAGHGQPKIVEAIQRQAACLDYAPAFQLSHPGAFELSNRILAMAPKGFAQVFYTNSGSESADTALKIALAYHRARGEAQRTRLIGRERGYHGVNFGGMSVGGIGANRKAVGQMLPHVDHIRHTHDPERNRWSRGQPEHGVEFADDLERLAALHDGSNLAAVIVEPVACSTGVLVPPVGYLQRLREICDRHGALLIFDEVITGFGRLGANFAADYFGVTPDIITLAKGLTNGAAPMGAVVTRQGIFETIAHAAGPGIELFHGYTYSAHPLACAAALATLDVYSEQDLFSRAAAQSPKLADGAHALRSEPHVVDVRDLGLMAAIELEARPGAPGARATEVFNRCFAEGLLVRVTGDIIALSPPFTVEDDHIALMIDILRKAIRAVD